MKVVSAETRIKRVPLNEMTLEWLVRILEDIAEQMADGFSKNAIALFDETTKQTGNVLDAKGEPLSEEMLLRLLEMMDFSFSPDGQWQPPTMIVGKEMFEKLTKGDRQPSKEYTDQLERLIERKHAEHRLSEANRVLAG